MDLVLFGIQGSGKGTQAKMLADKYGYKIFEAGGELLSIASGGTELGKTVKSFIDVGRLVPHEIIMQVVKRFIENNSQNGKLIFDGIPRDGEQMRDLDAIMREEKREFRCIHFRLDEDEAVRRIVERATIQGRSDDAKEEIVRRRMDTFRTKTLPVIRDYEKRGWMEEVDGSGTIGEVRGDVEKLMKEKIR